MKKLIFLTLCLMFPLLASCQTIRSFSYGFKMPSLTLGNTLITATGTQINYLNTTTSNVQTQLNLKAPLANPPFTGVIKLNSDTVATQSYARGYGGTGTGTVTSVTITTGNGVSATVSNATTAVAILFALGAITPTSVNGIVLSGSSTPMLAVTGTSSISGVNTGNNAVNTLYSGLVSNATHTGDVAGATTLTIQPSAVTLADMANMATASLIYRKTAGTGAPEVNSLTTLKADLGLTGTNSGDQVNITGNAATATKLAATHTLNGVAVDFSTNYTIPSDITPGTSGNLMESNGSTWVSTAPLATIDYNVVLNTQISASLTDGAPTAAEINTATGLTPSTAGAGYHRIIKDNNGTGLLYYIESDGTYWYYLVLTKAL